MIPEQYKTGAAYFMDFEFGVDSDTFIPRPETEILVETAVNTLKSQDSAIILDLCTGSGNIAISLTKYNDRSTIFALDISLNALKKARDNALFNEVVDRIRFIQGDLLSVFGKKRLFDMIVSNPPYVSRKDMNELSAEVKAEPKIALYGGEDGLDFYREIAFEAKYCLKKDAYIIMEMGYDQSKDIQQILRGAGYKGIEIIKDYSGIERIIKAKNG